MRARNYRKNKMRTTRGGGTAEFGPGLFVLLLCIFFPLIDMLSMGVSYCLCMVLNYNQVHEAARLPNADATNPSGEVMKNIPARWKNGMGKFVKLAGEPTTVVGYRQGLGGGGQGGVNNGQADQIVTVRTTVPCSPFLPIPFFIKVPGMNEPMTLQVFQECTMENPDYAP